MDNSDNIITQDPFNNMVVLDLCSNLIDWDHIRCGDPTIIVSPSAKIATWRYWFRLSRDVYVGNRSFASYTKTKTVESAV
jgi:hypothetical protein